MKYLQVIIPSLLFIIAAGLIMYDYNTTGENGILTVIGGIVSVFFIFSLLILTWIAKKVKK